MIASLPTPPVDGFDIGFTEIRVYGILIATAVLVAATWTRRRYERFGGDGELADRVTIWAVLIAFLGARLAYVTPRIDRFVDDPLGIIQIWEGGLALFGGLTFGLVALFVLMRRWRGDLPAFMDALAPAVPLAQAIGRWGNYFNSELYGTPTDLPWAVQIDNPVPEYAGFSTFHPTFLYESLANLVLVAIILRVERSGRLRRGSLAAVYAVGYGVIRFSLELIRTDTTWRFLGLSRNGWVSLVVIVAGLAFIRWWQRRPQPAVESPDATPEGAPTEASAVLVGVAEDSPDAGYDTPDDGRVDDADDGAADERGPDAR